MIKNKNMTDCYQNCGLLSNLNIRRIAKEIINITVNQCDECLDETLGKEKAGAGFRVV